MTIFKHELWQGRTAFVIWTGSIAFLLIVCVFMFPEMKGEMDAVGEMFASMGSFTAAFGMDRLNFGTLIGFYSIECGNILGLGGAFFASLMGVSVLFKEEKGRTAEFFADASHIENTRCHRETGGSPCTDHLDEPYPTWPSLVVDGTDWREYPLERGPADARGLLSAPTGAGGNLFRHISVPASWRQRDRYGACRHDVFFESNRQYDRTRKVSKIYNPIWILRRRRHNIQRKTGYRAYYSRNVVCLCWRHNGVLAV